MGEDLVHMMEMVGGETGKDIIESIISLIKMCGCGNV